MAYFDIHLKQLHKKITRIRQLESMIRELRGQRDVLTEKVSQLEHSKIKEQADVDRLEGSSLASFFYNVIGKMDEKLDKERQEAYAAAVKYDAAVHELTTVEESLAQYESELSDLSDCEERYHLLLKQKTDAVKASGGAAAEEILKLEEQISFLENQKKESQEAISAGKAAYSTVLQILKSLDSADGWSTFDLLGGGVIADVVKHSHLDEAQSSIEHLQSQLCLFRTELADISIQADMQVSIDGFMRFADYFFDGLFVDWAIKDQISQSRIQAEDTKEQINLVLSHLKNMILSAEQKQKEFENRIDELVIEVNL